MTEPNLYNVGYDVGFEDGFKEAQGRIKELEELLKAAQDDAKEAEAYAEELEAKLQAVVEDKVDVVVELTKLKTHLEDFFALLDITEQKDDGRYFHPTIIRSSRALDAEKLEKILAELKRSITANNKSDG